MNGPINHNIEPELLQSPPRSLKRRRGTLFTNGAGCIQLFLLPHTIVGIGLVLWALHSLAVIAFGVFVPAQVTHLHTKRGSKGSIAYNVAYTYPLGGQSYLAKTTVGSADYATLQVGSTLQVKVLALTPDWNTIPVVPNNSGYKDAWLKVPFALFWNGILLVFYIALYGALFKSKKLVSDGVAVIGEIQDKTTRRQKTTTYVISYAYIADPAISPANGGVAWGAITPLQKEMRVSKPIYDQLNKGDWVTVLYDPKKPSKSILYLASSHEAV